MTLSGLKVLMQQHGKMPLWQGDADSWVALPCVQASGLSEELASSRAALEQEQSSHSSSSAQLAAAQEALDQAQLEMSHMHHGHEEDAARLCKLQDKLQRATSALQVCGAGTAASRVRRAGRVDDTLA
jgi:hypothetical protein